VTGILRSLAGVVRVERPALVRFAVASLVGSILPMVSILILHQFLAGVLGHGGGLAAAIAETTGPRAAIWILALLLLVTFLASAASGFHTEVAQQRLVRTIELTLMERLVRHLMTLSVLVLERHSPGDLIEAVREDVIKVRILVISAATILIRALTTIALVGAAIWLSPRLAIIAFPVLVVAAIPTVIVAREVRRRATALRQGAYRVFDVILQTLRGIRVIKVYRGEQAEAARAVDHLQSHFSELLDITRLQAFGQVALESLGGLSVVIIVIVGGFQVMDGELTWPSLLAFLVAIRSTQGPLFQINSNVLLIQRNVAAVERLDRLFAEKPSPADGDDAVPFQPPVGRIAFDRVTFAYGPGAPALKDVTFEVSHGEVLGIVGPSGAGKTTLLNLTARFFDPTSGAIRINDRDMKAFRLADLYEQVAIVTQDPFLFSTTVRENIRCGRPDASDGDVIAAAAAAEIHDDIAALPEGYDTLVGTGHRGLSGGQMQRVNIARAILKNAPVLLLDEATSSLDSIAEERVQRAIARLLHGRTTLVVAHRLSTLHNATRILVLDGGRTVGLGTHAELLQTNALYRRMWQTQMKRLGTPARAVAFDGAGR